MKMLPMLPMRGVTVFPGSVITLDVGREKSLAAVEAAMAAGIAKAESLAGVVQHYIIPNPTEDTEKMLKIGAFDKN